MVNCSAMLDVIDLSCRRAMRPVFRGVSFTLGDGGCLQITGANGSGKTTLLRVMAGLLDPAAGDIVWNGVSIRADAAAHRARFAFVGHQDALKPEMTGDEMLAYWAALHGVKAGDAEDYFAIASFRHKPVRVMSAGQRRRLALSRLALGRAPLWLLDEPTTALDSDGQALLMRAIDRHRGRDGMVIAAVHHALPVDGIETFAMPGAA